VDTWIFLGSLFAASVGVLAFYGWAISAYRPPQPRNDLLSPAEFQRDRSGETEVDLGRDWHSTDDEGATWHLWWVPQTGEIVGLRVGAMPPPVGSLWSASSHTMRDTAYSTPTFTGMKVLGHLEHRPSRGLCEQLRQLPNGLDILCNGTHAEVPTDLPADATMGDDDGDHDGGADLTS